MRSGSEHGAATVRLGRHARHVLTLQGAAHIAKVAEGVAGEVLLGDVVESELLVVGQGENARGLQPGGVVDGGVVVDGLDDDLVLVGDARVVDVDEAVGRPGQEQRRVGRVEGEVGDVVAVDLAVLRLGGGSGADVPGEGVRWSGIISVWV